MVVGGTQSFLEQAARSFLPKPVTPDELKAIARVTLRQVEKQAENAENKEK